MKTLPGPYAAMLAGETTTLARILEMTAVNGAVFRMTDHDAPIPFVDGAETHVFRSDMGLDTSSVKAGIGGETPSFEFGTLLLSDGVTLEMIQSGALDGAYVALWNVDHKTPANGRALMFAGQVSRIKPRDATNVNFEVTPLLARERKLAQAKYGQLCRVDFGSPECGKDLEALKVETTITAVENRQVFTVDDDMPDDHWAGGVAVFTSGANAGFNYEIGKSTTAGVITLRLITAYATEAGDALTLYPGCAHTPNACKGWQNFINYRGEPFLARGGILDGNVTTPATGPSSTPPTGTLNIVYSTG